MCAPKCSLSSTIHCQASERLLVMNEQILTIYFRPRSRRDNTFGSVRLSVIALTLEPFDLNFWHEGWPWPWLGIIGQGQTVMKRVLTWHFVVFQPVLRSRSKVKGQGQSSRSKVKFKMSFFYWHGESIMVLGFCKYSKKSNEAQIRYTLKKTIECNLKGHSKWLCM